LYDIWYFFVYLLVEVGMYGAPIVQLRRPNSIGAGGISTICGTVTIGGVVTGNITDSPYTYPEP
jgi:hypothetical protein